jgi:branched-chain amino acid transport system ATP-binding protein
MSAEIVLQTEDLSRDFLGFVAVDRVNLSVRRGTIHSLIGPNGAGKTTLFHLLTGFLAPSRGRIRYRGKDITRMNPADLARQGLVRSFQISAVFARLTARENVRLALQRRRGDSFHFLRSERKLAELDARADELLDAVGLASFASTVAVEFSYGRKRALELATTLALDPEVLLLDEPMAGLGLEDIALISALIKKVAQNRTVLMVEHNLAVIAELSDSITVLTRGQIVAEGDYASVSANPAVRAAYLGVDDES